MRLNPYINTSKCRLTLFNVTKKYARIVWTMEKGESVMYIFYKPDKYSSIYKLIRYYLTYGLANDNREYTNEEVEAIYSKYTKTK